MIEFGNVLRTAREAKGYTAAQLADITHLSPSTIDELEAEDFSRIAAPIYGRGFVKLYCAAVGLNPRPLVEEFMNIYEGNREVTIRERKIEEPPVEAAAETAPEPSIPETSVPSAAVPESLPGLEAPDHAVSEEIPPRQANPLAHALGKPATPPPADPDIPTAAPAVAPSEPTLSRYAAPLREPTLSSRLPPNLWRMGSLGLAVLALIVMIGFGIRTLYRVTDPRSGNAEPTLSAMPQDTSKSFPETASPSSATKEPNAAREPNAAKTPAAPRMPIPVPDLYVD